LKVCCFRSNVEMIESVGSILLLWSNSGHMFFILTFWFNGTTSNEGVIKTDRISQSRQNRSKDCDSQHVSDWYEHTETEGKHYQTSRLG
jgi:hypothetical protein